MRQLLEARNRTLARDLEELTVALESALIPRELEPYRTRILSFCRELRSLVDLNLADVALGQDQILEDVLSNTQQVMQYFRLMSARLAVPVLRASTRDRLSLAIIGWLHTQHPATSSIPAAFADGDCSIWPFLDIAPIYFFPCVEQRGILYQPLLLHEFGHLLYATHKVEMDDLIGELQREVEEVLIPRSRRNDRHADWQAVQHQAIVDTWYNWAQELFCDAVGLTIGGPCFFKAFSEYLGTLERGDFYRQQSDLRYSEHPVTWMRVQFLAKRARKAGFDELAGKIEQEWKILSQTMGVVEDYHGFYDRALEQAVTRTIDDMLTEAGPRQCTNAETQGLQSNPTIYSPVSLLNHAWQEFTNDPGRYSEWETGALQQFLD